MLWFISCMGKPNQEERRAPHQDAHRSFLADKLDKGILVLSGPRLADDGSQTMGSMFIINVNNRAEVQDFMDNEPYMKAGVYASVDVTRVGMARWNPDAAKN